MFKRMKWSLLLSVFILIFNFSCSDSTSSGDNLDPNGEEDLLAAFKADEGAGVVKVMTRNIYIGADVDVVLSADSVEQIPLMVSIAFDQLQKTDFPARAALLAEEIEKSNPHLIGLQEVSTFYLQSPGDMIIGGMTPATEVYMDMETVLMAALSAKGLNYSVVARISNSNIELPMLAGVDSSGNYMFDDIRINDHDLILARSDVITSTLAETNYDTVLIVDPSLGIIMPRGYMAITAQVGTKSVLFANTHLEAFVGNETERRAQAEQLVADLNTLNVGNLPIVAVGDYNAPAPNNGTYQYVTSNGYTDAWTQNSLTFTYNPNGYTYGHNADVNEDNPEFYERIDFVMVKANPEPTYGEGIVIGDEKRDRVDGLYPSDHAGLVFKLTF